MEKIRKKYCVQTILNSVSEKQLDFLHFCLQNYDLIINKQINDIAKVFGVGSSFVYTFFEKLNIKNLKEFMLLIGYLISNSEHNILVKSYDKDDSWIKSSITMSESLVHSNLRLLLDQQQIIEDLICNIHEHKKIYYLGFEHSYLAINDLLCFFDNLNKENILLNDTNFWYKKQLNNVTDNDLLIIYSNKANDARIVDRVKELRRKNNFLKIYLITSNPTSELIKFVSKAIILKNIYKEVDALSDKIIISPVTTMIQFNNILKTGYFNKYKDDVYRSKALMNRIGSLRSIKKIKHKIT